MTPAYLLPPLADQYAAFLRAIAAAPDCDTPRLVLADWLEEKKDTVRQTCERCGSLGWIVYGSAMTPALKKVTCPDCGGEGSRWVSNGCGERAEFIRVQCELAASEYYQACLEACEPPEFEGCPMRALRKRERELWGQHKTEWFGERDFVLWPPDQVHEDDYPYPELAHAVVRRGFVDTVRGPLAAVLGGPCEAVGPHHRDRCDGGRIRCANAQFTQDCPDCHGTGRTPGALERMGPELLAVRRAEISDRRPYIWHGVYYWGNITWGNGRDSLPSELFDLLPDHGLSGNSRSMRGFRTEAAARDALSRAALSLAALALARRRAGLECEPVDPLRPSGLT